MNEAKRSNSPTGQPFSLDIGTPRRPLFCLSKITNLKLKCSVSLNRGFNPLLQVFELRRSVRQARGLQRTRVLTPVPAHVETSAAAVGLKTEHVVEGLDRHEEEEGLNEQKEKQEEKLHHQEERIQVLTPVPMHVEPVMWETPAGVATAEHTEDTVEEDLDRHEEGLHQEKEGSYLEEEGLHHQEESTQLLTQVAVHVEPVLWQEAAATAGLTTEHTVEEGTDQLRDEVCKQKEPSHQPEDGLHLQEKESQLPEEELEQQGVGLHNQEMGSDIQVGILHDDPQK